MPAPYKPTPVASALIAVATGRTLKRHRGLCKAKQNYLMFEAACCPFFAAEFQKILPMLGEFPAGVEAKAIGAAKRKVQPRLTKYRMEFVLSMVVTLSNTLFSLDAE